MNIIKTEVSREAIITAPEPSGRLERWARQVLRRGGLLGPPKILNLFQAGLVLYRFETDDGRFALVPMTIEMYEDVEHPEAIAREQALEALADLAKP